MPSNCTVPEPDSTCPPGTTLTGALCCDSNDEEGCEDRLFWNFTNNTCNDTPQTQAQCDGADWYWNFTNSTCGDSPAIGMCAGGPDWSNYFSSGCYTGLGLFGGLCGRSTTFINKCYQDNGDYDGHYCVCLGCDWCGGSPILVDVPVGLI